MVSFFAKRKTIESPVSVVFDVGGTKMRVATVVGGKLHTVEIGETPKDSRKGMEKLIHMLLRAAQPGAVSAAGCIAGRVEDSGEISGARNLRLWEGVNIVEVLNSTLQMPVTVFNDGELVGLAESRLGSGVGFSSVAYITVSTGVGGALIKDGLIDFAASDIAVGRIPVGGSDLEGEVSGTAVTKKFNIKPKDLASREERDKLADMLAQGLTEVNRMWRPDVFVLGGSMIVGEKNTIPLLRVEKTIRENLPGSDTMPEIKKALLGDLGGLYGALEYLKLQGK